MDYRRAYIEGGCYFFTLALADRNETLLIQHIDALRAAFKYVKERHPFTIDAIVILPDHLHSIWTLPEKDSDYSKRWSLIKMHFSKRLPKTQADYTKANAAFGKDDIGNIAFAMSEII